MGVQSAMVRLFMRDVPSTNVMTTNTTQLAVDVTLVLLSLGRVPADEAEARQGRAARERCRLYLPPMVGFVSGTAIAALCYQVRRQVCGRRAAFLRLRIAALVPARHREARERLSLSLWPSAS